MEGIRTAGELGALGLDPMRYLETKDGFERNLMVVVGQEIANARQRLDHNLAIDIANNVGKLFKK
jgi:hypothetical protein